jgi:Mg2+-importing ATPase
MPGGAAAATVDAVLADLGSTPEGLSAEQARTRLARYGPNAVGVASRSLNGIVLEQVKNGINLLLAGAGLLTIITGDLPDGAIILALIALNVGLSIVQEYRAEKALEALRHLLPLHSHVKRDGTESDVLAEQLVPGDFVLLGSGDVVPADIRLIEAHELEVDQATLTGESVPQTKAVAPVNTTTASEWTDIVFAGTTVVGGAGAGVVVATGSRTQFGETASLVKGARAAGDFQVNLSRFAGFLLRFGLVLATVVFISNALLGRGVLVSLTLALALALGIVPEALPAVTATTLALGARALARKRVLVRRLAAIEDLSAIDTLCIDKTGTITENRTELVDSWSLIPKDSLLVAAVQCSSYPRKGANVIDDALIEAASGLDVSSLNGESRHTVTEFNAETRQMCVSVGRELIYKGAAATLLVRCRSVKTPDGVLPLEGHQQEGARVLAVAAGAADVPDLTLLGLIAMSDPPRPGAADALRMATDLGIEVKIVTGDALPRAAALAKQIGMEVPDDAIISARDLNAGNTSSAAIVGRIFAETVPADKFRLVQTLQRLGRHVAVTGDGVNDAPALQTADVGIALASGTDATKGAADLVLLEDNLKVIVDGIDEGRRTFTNINRYLLYTMVSNFANVIIVAVASLVLPFIPLTPGQVLLLNLLADLPMLAIVTDLVSADDVSRPRHWDVRRLVELSIFLGLINAVFAFGLLRLVSTRSAEEIHTVWFLFLGSSALLVLFAVRNKGWFFERPWPSLPVVGAVAAALVVTVGLVNLPPAKTLLGFGTLGALEQLGILAYALAYVAVADVLQTAFRRTAPSPKEPTGKPAL